MRISGSTIVDMVVDLSLFFMQASADVPAPMAPITPPPAFVESCKEVNGERWCALKDGLHRRDWTAANTPAVASTGKSMRDARTAAAHCFALWEKDAVDFPKGFLQVKKTLGQYNPVTRVIQCSVTYREGESN